MTAAENADAWGLNHHLAQVTVGGVQTGAQSLRLDIEGALRPSRLSGPAEQDAQCEPWDQAANS